MYKLTYEWIKENPQQNWPLFINESATNVPKFVAKLRDELKWYKGISEDELYLLSLIEDKYGAKHVGGTPHNTVHYLKHILIRLLKEYVYCIDEVVDIIDFTYVESETSIRVAKAVTYDRFIIVLKELIKHGCPPYIAAPSALVLAYLDDKFTDYTISKGAKKIHDTVANIGDILEHFTLKGTNNIDVNDIDFILERIQHMHDVHGSITSMYMRIQNETFFRAPLELNEIFDKEEAIIKRQLEGKKGLLKAIYELEVYERQVTDILQKILNTDVVYKYSEEFHAIVNKYGWKLPSNASDLTKIGDRDHNCVGSYKLRVMNNKDGDDLTRLLIRDKYTMEVRLEYGVDKIITEVYMIQCRGMYNKDVHPEHYEEIRNELIGQDISIVFHKE